VTVIPGPVVTTSQHALKRRRLPKTPVVRLLSDAVAFAADRAGTK